MINSGNAISINVETGAYTELFTSLNLRKTARSARILDWIYIVSIDKDANTLKRMNITTGVIQSQNKGGGSKRCFPEFEKILQFGVFSCHGKLYVMEQIYFDNSLASWEDE